MSADLLRKAATILRERAATSLHVVEITNGPNATTAYRSPYGGYYLDRQGNEVGEPREGVTVTRTFHEFIEPGVGLALADWLDACAGPFVAHMAGSSGCRKCDMRRPNLTAPCPACKAEDVARLIVSEDA